MATKIQPESMWAIPSRYAQHFKVYLSPTPEIRSVLIDAETGDILAIDYWDDDKENSNGT